jgi:hypothetical protein
VSERPADGADRFPLVDPTALRIGFGFDIHRLVPDRRLMLVAWRSPSTWG